VERIFKQKQDFEKKFAKKSKGEEAYNQQKEFVQEL
jgi:hypothetical protein